MTRKSSLYGKMTAGHSYLQISRESKPISPASVSKPQDGGSFVSRLRVGLTLVLDK
jgi:hypothetical protein